MAPNQIHDVGKLIREAVAQGWELDSISREVIVFRRGAELIVLRAIVRSFAELREHRRALGLPEHKSAEAK